MYLPIGVMVRDLDGAALLAFEAAAKGYGVILGGSNLQKSLAEFPKGILLQRAVDVQNYYAFLQDDSGSWIGHMVDSPIQEANCFFTGNPRYDIYRDERRIIFQQRVEKINNRFPGGFVLINTKFSKFNGYFGSSERHDKARRKGQIDSIVTEKNHFDGIAYHQAGFQHFVELTRAMSSKFPTHQIVLRPHPNEIIDGWRGRVGDLPNVHVIREGHVAPWILAAQVSIHTNCTTGIDAFLLDRPVISYRPISDSRFDRELPNALSVEAFDLERVLELVRTALTGTSLETPSERAERIRLAATAITNFEGDLASLRLLDALRTLDVSKHELHLRRNCLGRFLTSSKNRFKIMRAAATLSRGEVLKRQRELQKRNGPNSQLIRSILNSAIGAGLPYVGIKVIGFHKNGSNYCCVYSQAVA